MCTDMLYNNKRKSKNYVKAWKNQNRSYKSECKEKFENRYDPWSNYEECMLFCNSDCAWKYFATVIYDSGYACNW